MPVLHPMYYLYPLNSHFIVALITIIHLILTFDLSLKFTLN